MSATESAPPEAYKGPHGLLHRLSRWLLMSGHNEVVKLGVHQERDATYGCVTASAMGCTGFGETSNEAINALADGLVEEGWPDDR